MSVDIQDTQVQNDKGTRMNLRINGGQPVPLTVGDVRALAALCAWAADVTHP